MIDRQALCQGYNVYKKRITSLGKFEGQPWWLPAFWEMTQDDCSDNIVYDEDGTEIHCVIIDPDMEVAADILESYAVALWETDQGFVEYDLFEDESAYNEWLDQQDGETADYGY